MRRLINLTPGRGGKLFWGAAPLVLAVIAYGICSALRLAENPDDKLLPGVAAFGAAIKRMAIDPDLRSGHILFWLDSLASLRRLAISLGLATLAGLVFGIGTGALPYVRATFSPLIMLLSMIPPMAVLPILFIVFGLDEVSKIVLIVVGVTPFLIRDLGLKTAELPPELIIKAQTLGGSTWQIILRVILPQVLPRLLDGVRLSLGPAWLFLISAEAIAASEGLGYRIFLMRRYLAMDVILPYVAWITLLAFLMDWALRKVSQRCFSLERFMSLVALRQVWMEYDNHVVLERVTLDVKAGEFCALIGPSGCGKTTFLRLLLSMERPTRGRIYFDGKPLPQEPGPDRGVVFQRYSVYPHLSVVENVILGLEFRAAPILAKLSGAARRNAIAEADRLIDAVGLGNARDKYPAQLSGGMQQRLAIAQTLVRKPKLLLLDEPFGALDPGTKLQIHELILKLWREEGVTVFMVTHDLKEAFKLATRVLTFDKVRLDPQAPEAYGATVTFDLALDRKLRAL